MLVNGVSSWPVITSRGYFVYNVDYFMSNPITYRVSHLHVDLGCVDFDLGVPPSCPAAQPNSTKPWGLEKVFNED